jgi:hypothetical protein
MTDSNPDEAGYKVGYGKPPLQTRFKKGERRNPQGRRKAKKALSEIFKKVIAETVLVPVGEKFERITRGHAVMRANIHEALRNSKPAMANVYELINEIGMLDEIPESKRAYFAVPRRTPPEDYEREVDEVNRIGAELARLRRERGEDSF